MEIHNFTDMDLSVNKLPDIKIKLIIDSLTKNALGDIKRASDGGSKMGAFILCSCLIDAVAGFIKGADTKEKDYEAFVKIYLPSYNPTKLYKDLRCKLVHSYSEGGSYLFVDNRPDLHLKVNDSKIIINLENFISDIESALAKFNDALLDHSKTDLRNTAISRLDRNGIIKVSTLPVFFGGPPVTGSFGFSPPVSGSDM